MEFKVNGITFENEDGKDIQKLIKKELRQLKENGLIGEKYEGYTNSEIKEMDLNVQEYSDVTFNVKVKENIFEEKPCIKIYIEKLDGDYIHVGYLPKKLLKEYNQFKQDNEEITGVAELTGGKYKHCRYYEEDYEEKVEVETVELDYGLLVKLNIGNDNKTYKEEESKHEPEREKADKEIIVNDSQTNHKKEIVQKDINNEKAIPYIIIAIISITFMCLFAFLVGILD